MSYWSDNKAQAQQVGAILMLGFVVIVLSVFQSQIVPTENKQVEFEHSVEVDSEFQTLRNSIVQTSATGNPNPTAVRLGTQYPERLFFINPPPATGSMATQNEKFYLENVTVVDDGQGWYEDSKDYWNGSTQKFGTETIEYTANYRVLEDAPTYRIEHGVTVVEYPSNNQSRSEQPIIKGRDIKLTAITSNNNFRSQGTETKTFEPKQLSKPTHDIRVTGNNSNPIKIRLNTTLNASVWDRMLDTQPNVQSVSNLPNDAVVITLDGTKEYSLEMSQVGLGENVKDSGWTTDRRDNGHVVSYTDEDGDPVVELRDEFNNPVPGGDILIYHTDGNNQANARFPVDANGQVTDEYLQDVTFEKTFPDDFSYDDLDENDPIWFSVSESSAFENTQFAVKYDRYADFKN